jgi:TolB-like protein/DNA-binding SARP family transcriptional activator/Tfp pilus assembly protein PilF
MRIRLLGGLDVRSDAGDTVRLPSRKARALLAYLALPLGQAHSREKLAALLWQDSGEEQARSSLRQTLSGLRKALSDAEDQVILTRGDTMSLDPARVEVDVAAFESLAELEDPKRLEEAMAFYGGEFLEGFSLRGETFEAWLRHERERLRSLASSVLGKLLANYEAKDETEAGLRIASRWLSLDQLQEAAHRALMRLYARQGRHNLALRQYSLCFDLLRREIGVRPEPETQRLYENIRLSRAEQSGGMAAEERDASGEDSACAGEPGASDEISDGSPDRPGDRMETLPLPDRPSVAVLAFENLSGDPEQSYFSDGIAEDIITELSRYRSLFVIARHSSFLYRGDAVDVRRIGRELGVRYVLQGSVRKAGNRLRISAQLVSTPSGDYLWAERYDRDLGDVFAIQDEVARTIVSTIVGRLEDVGAELARGKPTDNLAAYDFVLRGQQRMQRYTREDYARAQEMFSKAIELDCRYARAHAWLAVARTYDWFWDMSEGGLAPALEMGRKALALDDHESKCHLALGVTHLFRWEHDEAEYHFDRATALNPNDDLIIVEQGRLLMYLSRPEDGAQRVREAMRLNPYHPNWYWNILGRCLHTAEQHAEAIAVFKRIDTPQFWVHAYLAACYEALGQSGQAKPHAARMLSLRPDFNVATFSRVLPYRDPKLRKRFLDGLVRGGLPT